MSRLAVLWSGTSLRAKSAQALESGSVYPGFHQGQPFRWLKGPWAYLGVNGARHFLWRLGVLHSVVDEQWLQSASVEEEVDALIIPEADALESRSIERLQEIAIRKRIWLIIAGVTNLPNSLLGVSERSMYTPQGYLWVQDDLPGLRGMPMEYPISPPAYPFDLVKPMGGTMAFGRLKDCNAGDGNIPFSLQGAAFLQHDRVMWIPSRVFEYLGGLLQGHADWWPLHRQLEPEAFIYLDRLCQRIAGWLRRSGAGRLLDLRVPPWGSYQHAVILRHDTDDSFDSTYWQIERDGGWPATYAVLNDRRAQGWVERLKATPEMELALHYRTNRENFWNRFRLRFSHQIPGPDRSACIGEGLIRQVRQARFIFEKIQTIHRHYQYVYYPELLLALEALRKAEPAIIGSGSLGRFQIIRYGGTETVKMTHPSVGVPFCFPIRPMISTIERHVELPLWESSALSEPNPDQIQRCVQFAQELPGGCYTWVYHPAHARGRSFTPEGTRNWFDFARRQVDRSWWKATAASVFRRVQYWSQLNFRRSQSGLELLNPAPEPILDVVLKGPQGVVRIERIEAGAIVKLPHPLDVEPAQVQSGQVGR